jgi:hypothetical protein
MLCDQPVEGGRVCIKPRQVAESLLIVAIRVAQKASLDRYLEKAGFLQAHVDLTALIVAALHSLSRVLER